MWERSTSMHRHCQRNRDAGRSCRLRKRPGVTFPQGLSCLCPEAAPGPWLCVTGNLVSVLEETCELKWFKIRKVKTQKCHRWSTGSSSDFQKGKYWHEKLQNPWGGIWKTKNQKTVIQQHQGSVSSSRGWLMFAANSDAFHRGQWVS